PASPTSTTSAAAGAAPSPPAASCRASPRASAGRTWTSPVRPARKASAAWPPAARSACCASGCWTGRTDRAAMPRADFYLIARPRFAEQPLLLVCELARRACDANQWTVILARDQAQAEELDDLLWAFDPDAYIPHQIAGDEEDELTP